MFIIWERLSILIKASFLFQDVEDQDSTFSAE